jgi:hypothetical protein
MTSPEEVVRKVFTDRDHGKGFVLSAFRTASGATKRKHIIAYSIYTTGDRCMKGELLGMC